MKRPGRYKPEPEAGSKEVEDVFKQWQQGGATQKDVIDAIVTGYSKHREPARDKLNKAALAFGTIGRGRQCEVYRVAHYGRGHL